METIVKIALCNRRTNARYKNIEKPWDWIRDRNKTPVRTPETAVEYPKLSRQEQAELKDQGGFVGGWLREGIRKNGNVLCRTVGALDADYAENTEAFLGAVRSALPGVEWFVYSTHRHTPENPRFRLVILLSRETTEDEYPALMRMTAKMIGMDFFDDSTYQANRMMYWASCPSDGDFVFEESRGKPLPVDEILSRYESWRDTAQWPVSSRQSEAVRRSVTRQQDPLKKEGVVGVFCRAYFPVARALEAFLSDIYAPTAAENRWDYIPADSSSGVVIYDDRFVYSHHTTDPACGKLLNAFDIVRVHRFGDMDQKESLEAMCRFALEQEEVKSQLDKERLAAAAREFGEDPTPEEDRDWVKDLTYNGRNGKIEDTVENLELILRMDPKLAPIVTNDMARMIEITGTLPWPRPVGVRFWRDADTAQLKGYLDKHYVRFSTRNHDVAFSNVIESRRYHPVRDYLANLLPWDGIPRVETLFIRCLQADDTPYVRAVTRKLFAAAIGRVQQPGVKFDSVVVLDGKQGIGKSSLLRWIAGEEYYSDTLALTDMSDKSGMEKLQGYWFAEIGELAGMKKADIERVKAFLSTQDDIYRPSFGRVVESHPRQCVIVATVNGEHGYLRDITGNRRFWVVKCHQQEMKRNYDMSPQERDQIWAEAVQIWKSGEKLYLEGDLEAEAETAQREAMEKDDRQGLVEAYLEKLLPEGWAGMDLFARRTWLASEGDQTRPAGMQRREFVSNMEIWAECFGRNPSDIRPQDCCAI